MRLELSTEGIILSHLNNFNSIKVRLERKGLLTCEKFKYIFQFHKGAIRTTDKAKNFHPLVYFNSIKVRLEPVHRGVPRR